jgi:hypothetical protein
MRERTDGKVNLQYVKKRPYIANYLKKLVENFEYSAETYNLAQTFADTILSKHSNMKYDLAVIGSMILAGIFIF